MHGVGVSYSDKADHLVLLSGGIDSAAVLALLRASGQGARALFIDYGQAARKREGAASAAIASHFNVVCEVIKVEHSLKPGAGEVMGRNSFLIFTAACLSTLRRGVIMTGIHSGTRYFDCSEPYLTSTGRLVEEQSDGAIRLMNPFSKWSKSEVMAYAKEANVPIELTYSCENGGASECGNCASCRDRLVL